MGLAEDLARRKLELQSGNVTQDLKNLKAINAEKERLQRDGIENLPELTSSGLLSGESKLKTAAITPVLLTALDPREIGQILSSQFDSIGITETKEGEILATNRKNGVTAVINKPGISKIDVLQGLGLVSAFTPAGAAKTIPGRIFAAGATETALQTGQQLAGGEANPEDVAFATGSAGIGEAIAPIAKAGMKKISDKRLAKKLASKPEDLTDINKAVNEGVDASARTGIELFPAQKTVVPSELEKQSFVASLPAGARKARQALIKQNKQAAQAVDDVLNQIAPAESLQTAASRTRTAAKKAQESIKTSRKELTDPLYELAKQDKSIIDVSDITNNIDTTLTNYPKGGEIQKTLTKVKGFLDGENTIEMLHNSKVEIDQLLAKPKLGNNTKRELMQIKNNLLAKMDDINPAYKQAREEFHRLSPAVEDLQESIIGEISKYKDKQLKNIAPRLYDPAQTNPEIIRQAKKTIESIDPKVWREITRTELERRLGTVRAVLGTTGESVENLPGQLDRAIFGNAKQTRVLFEGAPTDVKQNLAYLKTALRRAKLGRPGGSQTATRTEIVKELDSGFISGIREFFGSPLRTTASIGEEAARNRKVAALAEAMYSTEFKVNMNQIRQMPTGATGTGKAIFQLLRQIEASNEDS